MKRYLIVPVVASLLLGGLAVAQTAMSAEDTAAPAPAGDGPNAGWHGHHHHMGMHHHDPLAKLQKPLTADAVKQALTDAFAKRPQVKSVSDKDANTLVVEITDPEGKTHKFEVNKTTGARRPAW
jgi:Spy/CpxP family protein refolding chaperone